MKVAPNYDQFADMAYGYGVTAKMNRRAFLRSLGMVTAAATVDRTYFFAPAAGWKPHPMSLPEFAEWASGGMLLTPWQREILHICTMFRVPPRLVIAGRLPSHAGKSYLANAQMQAKLELAAAKEAFGWIDALS